MKKIIEPYLVVLSSSLFFFYELIQVNIFNALNLHLMKTFNLTAFQLGKVSSFYFFANIIFLFPSGIILDKFPVKKVIISAMLFLILCIFCFSMSQNTLELSLARFGMGIGGCFTLTSSIRLAVEWFPTKKLAFITGAIISFAFIGGIVAQSPFSLLSDDLGWRMAMLVDSVFGLLLLLPIIVLIKEPLSAKKLIASPSRHKFVNNKLKLDELILKTTINSQNWLGGIYTSLMNIPLILLGAMWGGLYLTQARQFSRINSSLISSMIFIGMIIGSPIMGWFSDKIGRRKQPMVLCSLISLILSLYLIYKQNLGLTELLFLFFCLGFFTSAQIISYPLIAESNPLNLNASSEGLAQTLVMAGGLTQALFGYLIELNWDHMTLNQVPIYSFSNYQAALIIIPIGFIGALIAALLSKETFCKPYPNKI